MPQRNIDRIQDAWHAAGRYQRAEHLDPRTRKLIDEMFPPVRHGRTPGGYASSYIDDMTERILAAVRDEALTRPEIAARVGLSPKYIAKALAVIVDAGHLTRNAAMPGQVCRYWKPGAAEAA